MAFPEPLEFTVRFLPMMDPDTGRGTATFWMGCVDVLEGEGEAEVEVGSLKASTAGIPWLNHRAEPHHQLWRLDVEHMWKQFEAVLKERHGEAFLQKKEEIVAAAREEANRRAAARHEEERIEEEARALRDAESARQAYYEEKSAEEEPEKDEPKVSAETPPESPGEATRIGGKTEDYPQSRRRSELFPDYLRKARASVSTYKGILGWASHYYPQIRLEPDPIWDGEAWRNLWGETAYELNPSGLWSFDRTGLVETETIDAICDEIDRRLPRPKKARPTEEELELGDVREHAYTSETEAWRWIELVWELILEPLGRFKLVREGAPSEAERKYDPKLRREGD